MTHCNICGSERNACRNTILEHAMFSRIKVCDYTLDFWEEEKIVLIVERPESVTISLTNCIEEVIQEVVAGYNLCFKVWTFVEHAKEHDFFGYQEVDLVDVSGGSVLWKYLWHSDAKGETKRYSKELIVERVNKYRSGATKVIE